MSVETVNDHVLIPHRPDWRQRVEWTRTWDTQIRDSLSGQEVRMALRPRGRVGLRFRTVPFDDTEHQLLQQRIREALRTGRVAVPFFGRGVALQVAASAAQTTLALVREPSWEWDNSDWLWIGKPKSSDWATWETVQLDHFPGNLTAVLATGLVNAYPAGTFLYPLLFGRTELGEGELLDDHHGAYTVKMEETAVRPVPEPTTT